MYRDNIIVQIYQLFNESEKKQYLLINVTGGSSHQTNIRSANLVIAIKCWRLI